VRDRGFFALRYWAGWSVGSAYLLGEVVPYHTTLYRFRNALVAADILEKLFAELDR
jgi:hypothetical protein